jgi:Domain of unknown function (DUF3825)
MFSRYTKSELLVLARQYIDQDNLEAAKQAIIAAYQIDQNDPAIIEMAYQIQGLLTQHPPAEAEPEAPPTEAEAETEVSLSKDAEPEAAISDAYSAEQIPRLPGIAGAEIPAELKKFGAIGPQILHQLSQVSRWSTSQQELYTTLVDRFALRVGKNQVLVDEQTLEASFNTGLRNANLQEIVVIFMPSQAKQGKIKWSATRLELLEKAKQHDTEFVAPVQRPEASPPPSKDHWRRPAQFNHAAEQPPHTDDGAAQPYAVPVNSVRFNDKLFPGFAVVSALFKRLADLSMMAEPEIWTFELPNFSQDQDYTILYNYLHHTFLRLRQEDKVASHPNKAAFNIGLFTPNHDEIYALFTPNNTDAAEAWYLKGFFNKNDRECVDFPHLEMADYYTDPSLTFYDRNLPVRVSDNVAHHPERFPEPFCYMNKFQLQNILRGAVETATERARRNPRIAIPHCYNGEIQLMLPLYLTDPRRPDLALVIRREGNVYLATTCLSLRMAYGHARVVGRFADVNWIDNGLAATGVNLWAGN